MKWTKVNDWEQATDDGRWSLYVKDATRRSRWVLLVDNASDRTYECGTVREAKETAAEGVAA